MKKVFSIGMAALCLGFYACGGGGGGGEAKNPNDVADDFANPTGTLTSSNANTVGQAAVDSSLAAGAVNPLGFGALTKTAVATKSSPKITFASVISPKTTLDESDITACMDASDTKVTYDWGCIYDLDDDDTCDGSGKTTTTIPSSDDDFYTITYDGFSVDCGEDAQFSCDGDINISSTNALLYCQNLSCAVSGEEHSFEGCVNAEGDALITVDGKTFVVESDISSDGTCTTVTMSITDSESTKTMTCKVSDAEEGCTTLDGVNEVSSCEIQ